MLMCDKPDMAITVLACFVVILTEHYCVLASFKKIYQKKEKFGGKFFQTVIIILMLVTHDLLSSFLSHPVV